MTATAKLELLPRKRFEITLEDATVITGQFGTWALKRFCDKQKITLAEAQSKVSDLSGFIDYFLCAVEGEARKKGEPFSFTDVHAADWIDQMGGITSEMFNQLTSHTAEEEPNEEKKTEVS